MVSKSGKKVYYGSKRRKLNRAKIPKVKNIAKSVRKIQRKEELKHVDSSIGKAMGLTTAPSLLNGVPISATATTTSREGNDITSTSLQFRYACVADANVAGPTICRVLICWDSQINGGTPSVGEVLDIGIITDAVFAPYARESQKRFKILYDRVHFLQPVVYDATSLIPYGAYVYKKRKLGRTVKYNGSGSTATDMVTNGLWLFTLSDQPSNVPNIVFGSRFYFKDD